MLLEPALVHIPFLPQYRVFFLYLDIVRDLTETPVRVIVSPRVVSIHRGETKQIDCVQVVDEKKKTMGSRSRERKVAYIRATKPLPDRVLLMNQCNVMNKFG